MKRNSKLLLAAGLSLVLSLACVAPSHAAEDVDDVSATDVADALAGVSPALVETAADASSTAVSAAVVDNGGTGVSVPRDPTKEVDLTVGGNSVSIGLPESDGATQAVSLESGAITYPTDSGVANTVIPLADGVQMLTTIAAQDAPTSFSYDIQIPQGGSIALGADGSAEITGAAGNPLVTTTAPWARDADGRAVPTRYEVVGTDLVQIVDHAAGDYAYPIVADPTYRYWWGGKEWWPPQRVNISVISAAVAGYLGLAGAALIAGSAIGVCNMAGRGIWVYWTWAGHVWCTGP